MSPAGSGKAQFRSGLGAFVDRHPDRSKARWLILAFLVGLGLIMVSGLPLTIVGISNTPGKNEMRDDRTRK
jgi:hypothetical protein